MYPVTKDFLGKPAPPGYVAGLGRGATGFTTRSDIGPARENTDSSAKNTRDATADDDATARFADAANEEGLLSSVAAGDASDEEADRIWAQIDQKMSHRRRKPLKPASEKDVNEPVDDQVTRDLQTLKRQLGTVSAEEWAAIPDAAQVAETAARAKRRRKAAGSARQGDRLAPASDSLLLAAFGVTPGAAHTEARDVTDFVALGQARDDVLRLTLDRLAPAASSEASVDRSGYLTSLAQPSASAAVADVGRARELLRSVTQANPRHAAAWIARARVEEMSDGGRPRARAVMAQACERCARSEDVWLEAARLAAGTQDARAVLAQAARHVPRSVRVWTMAAELEPQVAVQRRVLRRALEHVPGSSELWQKLVALEDNPDEARVLLAHAVDVAPHSADLWLALARLETHANAQRVLNRARRALPQCTAVWVAAVRLEEQHGAEDARLLAIARKAVGALSQGMRREAWLQEAAGCADDGFVRTCAALVRAAPADAEETEEADLVADARRMAAQSPAVARALYDCALEAHPTREALWLAAADFERSQPEGGQLAQLLRRAVAACASETLWLMAAKHAWAAGDVSGARALLEDALAKQQQQQLPPSERVLLALVKLESRAGDMSRALELLAEARARPLGAEQKGASTSVWLQSAVLLRQAGRTAEALDVCSEALQRFPSAQEPRLHMVLAQCAQALGDPLGARQAYARALRDCRRTPALWLAAAQLEEKQGSWTRARAVLERARVALPQDPRVWLASVRLEARADPALLEPARALLARALQACPRAGCLWAEAIVLAERAQRKARAADALKHAAEDVCVLLAVARLFWVEAKVEKARAWFHRACMADPDYGDAWAWHWAFESSAQHDEGELAQQRLSDIENACASAEPRHGDVWPPVAKLPENAGLTTVDVLRLVADRLARSRNPL